jgi:hypothetical protein
MVFVSADRPKLRASILQYRGQVAAICKLMGITVVNAEISAPIASPGAIMGIAKLINQISRLIYKMFYHHLFLNSP